MNKELKQGEKAERERKTDKYRETHRDRQYMHIFCHFNKRELKTGFYCPTT